MDIVRPAIKKQMQHVQKNETDLLRYNLLAIVEDKYQKASDALEMLKRERNQLERRLNEAYPDGWHDKVCSFLHTLRSCGVHSSMLQIDSSLISQASATFETSVQPSTLGRTFAQNFASRKLEQEIKILDMPVKNLPAAWEACIKAAIPTKTTVEDEIDTAKKSYVRQWQQCLKF